MGPFSRHKGATVFCFCSRVRLGTFLVQRNNRRSKLDSQCLNARLLGKTLIRGLTSVGNALKPEYSDLNILLICYKSYGILMPITH